MAIHRGQPHRAQGDLGGNKSPRQHKDACSRGEVASTGLAEAEGGVLLRRTASLWSPEESARHGVSPSDGRWENDEFFPIFQPARAHSQFVYTHTHTHPFQILPLRAGTKTIFKRISFSSILTSSSIRSQPHSQGCLDHATEMCLLGLCHGGHTVTDEHTTYPTEQQRGRPKTSHLRHRTGRALRIFKAREPPSFLPRKPLLSSVCSCEVGPEVEGLVLC